MRRINCFHHPTPEWAVFTVLLASALLLNFVGNLIEAKKVTEADIAKVKQHGITHCELKPSLCAPVCGTTSPVCELSGQCMCRKGPHPKGVQCRDPDEVEAKRCHRHLCLETGITRPMVCTVSKKIKLCACFPN